MLPSIEKPKAWDSLVDSLICCGGGVWIWASVAVALLMLMMIESVPS